RRRAEGAVAVAEEDGDRVVVGIDDGEVELPVGVEIGQGDGGRSRADRDRRTRGPREGNRLRRGARGKRSDGGRGEQDATSERSGDHGHASYGAPIQGTTIVKPKKLAELELSVTTWNSPGAQSGAVASTYTHRFSLISCCPARSTEATATTSRESIPVAARQ